MNSDLSLISLFLQASWVVKAVVLGLLGVSVVSWAQIVAKIQQLRALAAANAAFEAKFWSGRTLRDLHSEAQARMQKLGEAAAEIGPNEKLFISAMRELAKHPDGADHGFAVEALRRSMRVSFGKSMAQAEGGLSLLASVGSVSPYVGLFGTVWGIMHAFTGLASLKQVTLASVAPGIAEALIATAIGLFAAIPAVLAYNHINRRIDQLAANTEGFADELQNILQRQLAKG